MMIGMNKRFKRVMNRFKKADDGVTAVEFAFVGGPFFFMLFATFEFGIMLFVEYALAQNIETAGRLIRTGQVQMGANGHQDTAAYFKTKVCSGLNAVLDCTSNLYVDVRNFTDFSDIEGNLPNPVNGAGDFNSNDQYNPGAAGKIVTVRVYYKWKLSVPFLSKMIDLTNATGRKAEIDAMEHGNLGRHYMLLSAATTFRNEPFSDGS